jgi:hypothetical protein
MTSTEWRQDPNLVKLAAGILNDDVMKEMLKIVEAEGPLTGYMPAMGTSDGDKIQFLGRQLGHMETLSRLQSLKNLVVKPITVESSFEPDQPQPPEAP